MTLPPSSGASFRCAIAAWLTVRRGANAVAFYKSAFGATEVYRHDDPSGGVVARLSVHGAEFWINEESSERSDSVPELLGGGSVRIVLTVNDPDTLFAQAITAGASEIFPVGEGHGWQLGRLVDRFGLHWEIGHPLAP